MPEEKGGYDAIGNPKTYGGWEYTWKAGRMLESMHFFYDVQGRPSLIRYNGVDYAYLHNLQGDVVGMIDMDGTRVVEYTYDAWGKPQRTIGGLAATLGKDNPFRYRGYVYDEETGLYVTATRYYNPEWGRFINADTILGNVGAVLSHNLFAYCNNDPVNKSDPIGCSSEPAVELLTTKAVWKHNRKIGTKWDKTHYMGTGTITDLTTDITFKIGWGNVGDEYHTDWSPLTLDDTKRLFS